MLASTKEELDIEDRVRTRQSLGGFSCGVRYRLQDTIEVDIVTMGL